VIKKKKQNSNLFLGYFHADTSGVSVVKKDKNRAIKASRWTSPTCPNKNNAPTHVSPFTTVAVVPLKIQGPVLSPEPDQYERNEEDNENSSTSILPAIGTADASGN